jgi:hypothetical protein
MKKQSTRSSLKYFQILILFFTLLSPMISWSQKGGEEDDTIFEPPSGKSKLFDESKRAVPVLGGVALMNDDPGYYIEGGIRYEPRVVGFGIFTSFTRVPNQDFSNWTILAAQISVTSRMGFTNPYFTVSYGMFNFQLIGDKVNFRTCTLELGGGVENKFSSWASFMADVRWKRFADYGGEWDPINSLVFSVGLKFKRQSISSNR